MNINISNQLNPLEHAKHKTNDAKRSNAMQTQNSVKKMVKSVNASAMTSANDQVKLSTAKTKEMANAELEQKTAMVQSDVSSSSSVASKISVKERELLQAIAEGDYSKIKALSADIKSLIQELQASSTATASKYSNVQMPNIPSTAGAQSQNTNAAAKAAASAQQVSAVQAQVTQGANALKGNKGVKGIVRGAESQAQQKAQAIQDANVAKLAKLKSTAHVDKTASLKTKESLAKAETKKATAMEQKASRLANHTPETSKPKTTNPATQQQSPLSNKPTSGNHAQHNASNAYSKTQQNQQQQQQNDTRVSTEEIKAHPEKYASSEVLHKYTEELGMAKSLSGAGMANYIAMTEKVLAKADKAIKLAQQIGATDGSSDSRSRLADAVSDSGIVGSGDVPQSVLIQHRMLSQQHKLEKSQKDDEEDQDQTNNNTKVDKDTSDTQEH